MSLASVLLDLRGAAKRYGEDTILEAVDLRIDAGDLLLLRGPSGSGKTTLLRLIGLLEDPTSGSIVIDGRDVATASDRERANLRLRTIGHVFQANNMIHDLTILENVLVPMRIARAVDVERGRALLDEVGLAHRAGHYPSQVSVGERQRAAIARALVMRPRILLADEPTASLDAAKAAQILHLLRKLKEEHGSALVIASHDPRAWQAVGDARIVELDGGRVVASPS